MHISTYPSVYDDLPTGDDRYIRIVELEDFDSETGEVRCRLRPVQFGDSLDFRALSYCWGDPSNPPTIICNGTRLNVTSNLDLALRCLLRKGKTGGLPLTFWIDAICINQSDNHEKERQVMMMGDIYRQASEVIVWLGPAAEDSDLALDVCHRIYCQEFGIATKDIKRKSRKPSSVLGKTRFPTLKPLSNFSGGGSKFAWRGIHVFVREMDAIAALLQRPWWSRIWIIQEVTLPKLVTVLCGEAVVDWNVLDVGITISLARPWANFFVKLVNAHHAEVLFQTRRTALQVAAGLERPPASLFELISQFRWSVATEPRDKVYGLLGMANIGRMHQISKVSYEDSMEDCFRTIVLDIIRATGSLDVLQLSRKPPAPFIDSDGKMSTLPSWVPDLRLNTSNFLPDVELSQIAPIGLQSHATIDQGLSKFPHLHHRVFCASKNSTENDPQVLDSKFLAVQGIVFDNIFQMGEMQPGSEGPMSRATSDTFDYIRAVRARKHNLKKFLKSWSTLIKAWPKDVLLMGADCLRLVSWKRMAMSQQTEYPTGEPRSEAFAKTLHQGWLDTDPEAKIKRHIADWERGLGKVDVVDQSVLLRGLPVHSRRRRGIASLVFSIFAFFQIPDSLKEASTYTCLATTRLGYYALVPPETRPGDSIALLKGGPVPFVIRKRTEDGTFMGWELVGPCYVHGIMHGEQWDDAMCQSIKLV